ncbi:uncharacterized protein LOC108895488 [Lates calcarifer]|uniref:Uncharacterized protein LOC108895488 n=1 Tax=Lates calcarifer TaxID=8187 RepID=A0AAJ7Q8S7_LATCA|nr:uncharacterized protein LOC108895488 [Lates calcarifer]
MKDIISRSNCIYSGHPSRYQLIAKTEYFGTLQRITFGVKDHNKINKTILLVGETGTGKSTLINALVNYSMGVKYEDKVWFELVDDEKTSQTVSHTNDVKVYEICDFKEKTLPYSLTIIDTPGYGNTKGIEHDTNITERICDLFRSENGVHEINVVGLVLKSTVNRLDERLKYIFDSVVSLFGNDMEKNIVTLITHSNGKKPTNVLEALETAGIKCAKNEKNQLVFFQFDNCQHVPRTDDEDDDSEGEEDHSYKVTMKGMKQFTDFIGKTAPQKLQKTLHVLNERIRLIACIQNLQDKIELIELKQTEIQQIQEALKKFEQEMKSNENFTVEVDEAYKDKEPIDGGMWLLVFFAGAVCCTICEENCHYPGCTLAWYPRDCEVFKKGHCTVCTRKCPVSAHVKEKWRYENKTRKVKRTTQEMKETYEKNKEESEKMMNILEKLEKKNRHFQVDKAQLLEESYQHIVHLEQIALNVNSLSTHFYLEFLIEKMKEKGDAVKVHKLEELASRVDEVTRAGLCYMKTAKSKKKKMI